MIFIIIKNNRKKDYFFDEFNLIIYLFNKY